jgi:hypothetical protein
MVDCVYWVRIHGSSIGCKVTCNVFIGVRNACRALMSTYGRQYVRRTIRSNEETLAAGSCSFHIHIFSGYLHGIVTSTWIQAVSQASSCFVTSCMDGITDPKHLHCRAQHGVILEFNCSAYESIRILSRLYLLQIILFSAQRYLTVS